MSALLRAEWLKLRRQPSLLFWGFVAVPLFATLFKAVLPLFIRLRSGYMPPADADWLASAASAFAVSGNAFAQLFFAIGVAAVFHAEYRHAMWRQWLPRAGRLSLWGAKLVFCLACLAASLALTAAGDLLLNAFLALSGGAGAASPGAGRLGLLALSFLAGWLELAVLAALVAAVMALTRSLIGAVLFAFLLAIGSGIAGLYAGQEEKLKLLPSLAAQTLRHSLAGGEAGAALGAFALLLLWLAAATAFGAAVFSRQDLSSE